LLLRMRALPLHCSVPEPFAATAAATGAAVAASATRAAASTAATGAAAST
jgi:hypothetical protein